MNIIRNDKIILFTGAGISIDSPTCLPGGRELTEYCLDFAVGQNLRKKILKRWGILNSICRDEDVTHYGLQTLPRLETVIEGIYSAEMEHKNIRFIEGFKKFNEVNFNNNHLILASLLQKGIPIITTNFDTCIQKAYKHSYKEELIHENREGIHVYKSIGENYGKLYHIHGIANDCNGLGVTVNKLKNGFPSYFIDMMKKWISEKYKFYFIGYSGSDFFDVNYMFEKLKGINRSEAIVVNHNGSASPDSFEYLVRNFETSRIENIKTSIFLEKLSAKYKTIYIENKFFEYKSSWNDGFDNLKKENEKHIDAIEFLKLHIIVKLRIGFNYKIDIDRILKSKDIKSEKDKNSIVSSYYNYLNKVDEYIKYYNLAIDDYDKDDRFALEDYKKNNLKECINKSKYSLKDILNIFKTKNYEVNWGPNHLITLFQCYSQVFIEDILRYGEFILSNNDKKQYDLIIEVIQTILNKSYSNFTYLNQLCIILRTKSRLEALEIGKGYKEAMNKALALYSNMALVDGYMSCYRDLAIIEYFKIRFHKNGSYLVLFKWYLKSISIAFLVGSKRDIKKSIELILKKIRNK